MQGDWRITSTEVWDRDALDLVQPAFIRFEEDRIGEFGMNAIRGAVHWYPGERDGKLLGRVDLGGRGRSEVRAWVGDDRGRW